MVSFKPFAFVWTLLWLGLLLAGALAAVGKFAAPSLPYAVGLDVGRHVFALLFRAELVLAAGTFGSLLLGPRSWASLFSGFALMGILAIQGFWLLPALSAHTVAALAGHGGPVSRHHLMYILLDGIKVLLLIRVTISAMRLIPLTQPPEERKVVM